MKSRVILLLDCYPLPSSGCYQQLNHTNHFLSSSLLQVKYHSEYLDNKLLKTLNSCPSLVKFISDKQKIIRAITNINCNCLDYIDDDSIQIKDFDFWYRILYNESSQASCFKSDRFLIKLIQLFDVSRDLFLQAIRRGLSIDLLIKNWSHHHHLEVDDLLIATDRELLMVAAESGHVIIEYVDEDLLLSDRELLLCAVRNNFVNYSLLLDEELKMDEQVALEALNGKSKTYKFINHLPRELLRECRQIQEACIGAAADATTTTGGCLEHFGESEKEDRELVLKCVKAYGDDLNHASDRLRSDREIVLEAVKSNGGALKFASQSLKSDREVVLEAMKNSLEAFPFISKELKQDVEFINYCLDHFKITSLKGINDSLLKSRDSVLKLVRNGMTLYATDQQEGFRNDREIVLNAVTRRGSDLQFASDDLKMDEEIVRAAVKQNSSALEFANERFQLDKDFVLESISSKDSENCYLHPNLTCDREFVLKAIRKNGYLLQKTKFKDDHEMILEACRSNPFFLFRLKLFQPGLYHNRQFAMQVVSVGGGSLLQLFDESIRRDEEIVLTALENDTDLFNAEGINSLAWISPELLKNQEFMILVVELIRRRRF